MKKFKEHFWYSVASHPIHSIKWNSNIRFLTQKWVKLIGPPSVLCFAESFRGIKWKDCEIDPNGQCFRKILWGLPWGSNWKTLSAPLWVRVSLAVKNALWSESSLLWNTHFWKIHNVQGSGHLDLEQKYQR